jgi:hypothetical protein
MAADPKNIRERSYKRNAIMPITPDLMRLLLLICMLSMVILAAFYLRARELSTWWYALWSLVVILLPLIGPFFVIWMRPGSKRISTFI